VGAALGKEALAEIRRETRDEVQYRTHALGSGAKRHTIVIGNISPHGLMGRCKSACEVGERLEVELPVVGAIAAEVRWAVGGQIGAQFDAPIGLAHYYALVATLLRPE